MDPLESAAAVGAGVLAAVVGSRLLRRRRERAAQVSGVGQAVAAGGQKIAETVGHTVGTVGHRASSVAEQAITGAGKVAAAGAAAAIDMPVHLVDRLRRHEPERPQPAAGPAEPAPSEAVVEPVAHVAGD